MTSSCTIPDHLAKLIAQVRARNLTYLSDNRLRALCALCLSQERDHVPGIIIEAGCALGGSAIALCASKASQRALFIYDVFAMIPPPSDKDGDDVHQRYATIKSGGAKGIGGECYYGYRANLDSQVRDAFSELGYPVQTNNVSLIRGMLQDTLFVNEPVSLAHIDVDWYEPVKVCLERIVPRLSENGVMVIDDYQDWSGCRAAVDEYFQRLPDLSFEWDLSATSLVVRKIPVR